MNGLRKMPDGRHSSVIHVAIMSDAGRQKLIEAGRNKASHTRFDPPSSFKVT